MLTLATFFSLCHSDTHLDFLISTLSQFEQQQPEFKSDRLLKERNTYVFNFFKN